MPDSRYAILTLSDEKLIFSMSRDMDFDQLVDNIADIYYDSYGRSLSDDTINHFIKMFSYDGVIFWSHKTINYAAVDIDYDYKWMLKASTDIELLKKANVPFRIFSQLELIIKRDDKIKELGL